MLTGYRINEVHDLFSDCKNVNIFEILTKFHWKRIFLFFFLWRGPLIYDLQNSRGNDFELSGYFSYKLDAYIHMELKTKKFYLQNSGHGSASNLVTKGRV